MLKAQVMATSQEGSNILQIPSPIEKTAALPTGRPPLMAFVADATVPETLLPDTELICESCTQLEQALDSASAAPAFALRSA